MKSSCSAPALAAGVASGSRERTRNDPKNTGLHANENTHLTGRVGQRRWSEKRVHLPCQGGVAGSNPVVRSRRTAGQGRWKPAFLRARNRRKCQGSRRGPVSYTTSSRIRRPGRPFDYRPPRGSAGGPALRRVGHRWPLTVERSDRSGLRRVVNLCRGGFFSGRIAGRRALVIGGVHGNEPQGAWTVERLLQELTCAAQRGERLDCRLTTDPCACADRAHKQDWRTATSSRSISGQVKPRLA
jgi:hypothetical protein